MPSLLWQLHHSEDGSNLNIPAAGSSSSNSSGHSHRIHHHPIPEEEEEQEEAESKALGDSGAGTTTITTAGGEDSEPKSSGGGKIMLTGPGSLPSLESAFEAFKSGQPSFDSTLSVDETRESEFPHLRSNNTACFDYCGFGLFTYTQSFTSGASRSNFGLASSAGSGGIHAQAVFSNTEPGTLQSEVRARVLEYLNLSDGYSVIFTASKRAAFNLVAECYDFRSRSRLVTVYDHESESVKSLLASARQSEAKISPARFKWPSLGICGEELASELKSKSKSSRRRSSSQSRSKGLFVFPTQSRITGTKYSYQWMIMAEKHRWDVLLDVSAMGPRDMGSLGLSLFRPDFIVCSFYKVFGADPTGFGCLLIKNTSLHTLRASSVTPPGMVKLVPVADDFTLDDQEDDGGTATGTEYHQPPVIAFSGPVVDQPVVSERDVEEFREFGSEDEERSEVSSLSGPLRSNISNGECEIQECASHDDELGPLPNGDAHYEDDSVFRKIGRDDGLIDSRRSDRFSRFLPIREDEEFDPDEQQSEDNAGASSSSFTRRREFYDNYEDNKRNVSDEESWDDDFDDEQDDDIHEQRQEQPLILCRGLELAKSMGLNRTNCRIKSLMEWLISSMSLLVHQIPRESASSTNVKRWRKRPLVQIIGPKSQTDRGPAVAFNLYDHKGVLIQPAVVQKLADRCFISLGCGCLSNLYLEETLATSGSGSEKENSTPGSNTATTPAKKKKKKKLIPDKCSSFGTSSSSSGTQGIRKRMANLPVLTATLGLVSSFEDVYRLWTFAAKFLDPDFLVTEMLQYQSLNQETVVIGEEQQQQQRV